MDISGPGLGFVFIGVGVIYSDLSGRKIRGGPGGVTVDVATREPGVSDACQTVKVMAGSFDVPAPPVAFCILNSAL